MALLVCFQLRACLAQQTTYAVWKIIKCRAESLYGRDIAAQDSCLSRVGTFADIITEIHEIFSLGLTVYLSKRSSFTITSSVLFANVIFVNFVSLLTAIYVCSVEKYTSATKAYQAGASESISQPFADCTHTVVEDTDCSYRCHTDSSEVSSDDCSTVPSTALNSPAKQPSATSGSPSLCHLDYDLLSADEPVDASFRPRERKCLHVCGVLGNAWASVRQRVYHFFKERYDNLTANPIARVAVLHSFLLYFIIQVLSNPLNMTVAASGKDELSGVATRDNFCNGMLANLAEQGLFAIISYTVGSILYVLFLIKCPPFRFYRYIFPVCSALLTMFLVPFLLFDLHPSVAAVLVAASSVLPYYLNAYDYYLATSAITPNYYGFFASFYGNVSAIIYLIPAALMLDLSVVSKETLIVASILLLAVSVVVSFWFSIRHKTSLKALHKDCHEGLLGGE
eukprot:GILK01014178.1.p1 GENE.GILK01014178.1~~GILK01014178.1.p1  ORF type:complete len:515 (+),score=49.48 GILK01014178.1:189-1547(+)